MMIRGDVGEVHDGSNGFDLALRITLPAVSLHGQNGATGGRHEATVGEVSVVVPGTFTVVYRTVSAAAI